MARFSSPVCYTKCQLGTMYPSIGSCSSCEAIKIDMIEFLTMDPIPAPWHVSCEFFSYCRRYSHRYSRYRKYLFVINHTSNLQRPAYNCSSCTYSSSCMPNVETENALVFRSLISFSMVYMLDDYNKRSIGEFDQASRAANSSQNS
ncbi:unnamed protein product [Albugo candida]|uniref:Uncharacterized protein n=1 Tax=Albugo candida TaxID=65357 RepID=A0A024FWK7_9STRA|nr:unnamed protein product [Albugo candida]|eukprot:CCI11024.1 unnamed protein product [Albugo candida]